VNSPAAQRKQLLGTVRGRTIELDEPVDLDGKRVVVFIEADESGEVLTAEAQKSAWDAWVKSPNQGPIEDEDDAFP
jgi:hypothetical protein